MLCLGSILDVELPMEVYVAGLEHEGEKVYAVQGQYLYLNGPKTPLLKVGDIQQIIRPIGRVIDPLTGIDLGTYYKTIGTVRVETVDQESATASVVFNCSQAIVKGDLALPMNPKQIVQFEGTVANSLTPFPKQGLKGAIVLGKDELRELAGGQFCFINLGWRNGVKPGDRFTVYRIHPPLAPNDLRIDDSSGGIAKDTKLWSGIHQDKLESLLKDRTLPPRVMGDVIILDVSDTSSVAKIVNSKSELHIGDIVVKQ